MDCPALEDNFVLTHGDLHVKNIMIAPRSSLDRQLGVSSVTDVSSHPIFVTAMLDWEFLVYQPRWDPTDYQPTDTNLFAVYATFERAFQRACVAHGFPDAHDWVRRFKTRRFRTIQDWLGKKFFKHSKYPNFKFLPPEKGMRGYRYDLDDSPETQAYVAAFKAEQVKKPIEGE